MRNDVQRTTSQYLQHSVTCAPLEPLRFLSRHELFCYHIVSTHTLCTCRGWSMWLVLYGMWRQREILSSFSNVEPSWDTTVRSSSLRDLVSTASTPQCYLHLTEHEFLDLDLEVDAGSNVRAWLALNCFVDEQDPNHSLVSADCIAQHNSARKCAPSNLRQTAKTPVLLPTRVYHCTSPYASGLVWRSFRHLCGDKTFR